MDMPASFTEIVKNLSTEDLEELRQWNAGSYNRNAKAIDAINQELERRATETK